MNKIPILKLHTSFVLAVHAICLTVVYMAIGFCAISILITSTTLLALLLSCLLPPAENLTRVVWRRYKRAKSTLKKKLLSGKLEETAYQREKKGKRTEKDNETSVANYCVSIAEPAICSLTIGNIILTAIAIWISVITIK